MPAQRRYKVKGTKDFIALAGIFFFLCIWAIKDAWYPSDKVMKKHPQEVRAAFEIAGTVVEVLVETGDPIFEDRVLAKMRTVSLANEFEMAKEAYSAAKQKHGALQQASTNTMLSSTSKSGASELNDSLKLAKTEMDQALAKVEKLRLALDATELRAPSSGKIKEVLIKPHDVLEANQTAFVIDPEDHFYTFNKSLAIFSFVLFWIFLVIHIVAR